MVNSNGPAYLDLWVVRGDAVADQPKGHGQCFVHIDLGVWDLTHDPIRGIEACGTRSNHRHAKRSIV